MIQPLIPSIVRSSPPLLPLSPMCKEFMQAMGGSGESMKAMGREIHASYGGGGDSC